MAGKTKPMSTRSLEPLVRQLLAEGLEDQTLLQRLEELAAEHPALGGCTPVYGPALYGRNKVMFRPFILARFSTYGMDGWRTVPLRFDKAMDAWLDQADAQQDIQLFQRLYTWKISKGWRVDAARWRTDLLDRLTLETSQAARALTLQKFDLHVTLDEAAAVAIYRAEPKMGPAFILKHMPWAGHWSTEKRSLWPELLAMARSGDDGRFEWDIYRRRVPYSQWRTDVLTLADLNSLQGDALLDALAQRHPNPAPQDVGRTFADLLERRGRDVMPYVLKHLKDVWGARWSSGAGGYREMLRVAQEKSWWDLWAGLLRTCAPPKDFDQAVDALIHDTVISPAALMERARLLTGPTREFNLPGVSFVQVNPISDKTAVAMHQKHPYLLGGPFLPNIQVGWQAPFPKLLARALAVGDQPLVDFLASRLVTRDLSWGGSAPLKADVDMLAEHYLAVRNNPEEFSRRAVAVLSQVPAYTVWNYGALLKSNRLARLMLERSLEEILQDGPGLRDLLEAPAIHVQLMAFKALALDRDAARSLAAAHVDLLAATLLRPLHRRTRLAAFAALKNAAADTDAAAFVLRQARQATALPDKRYPKDALIALMGHILATQPSLQNERERPRIYGEVRP